MFSDSMESYLQHLRFEPNSCSDIPVVYECLEAGCSLETKSIHQ